MKPNEKKYSFIFEHRYAALFFLYVVLYNFLVVNRLEPWKVSSITYAYHIVDYSLGFQSQLLPGAIFYGLFGEHASRTTATIYETILLLLFFMGLSILLERLICCVEQKQKPAAACLILFYLSGPFTFAIFVDELGMLDVYWLFFSLLFFLFLEKKGLRLLIPVLFGLSLLVHFSSILNYLILFSILLLYRISIETEKKNRIVYWLIFVLSLSVTAGIFAFFLLNHAKDMPLSMEEFHQMLRDRGSEYYLYYDYSFYNYYFDMEVVPSEVFSIESPVLRMIRVIIGKCLFTMKSYAMDLPGAFVRLLIALVFLTPVMGTIYKILFRLLKSIQENRLKRFCMFLMMVQFPFTVVLGCLFSPDIIRWSTHGFLISFSMLLYLLYHEEAFRTEVLDSVQKMKEKPSSWVFFLAYFLTNAWPYC